MFETLLSSPPSAELDSAVSFRNFQFMRLAILAICCLTIAIYTVGPGVEAKWGWVDDHEIALFLGPDRTLSLSEIIPTLLSTEVGAYGTTSRYRPGYYIARILECFLWGGSPQTWYLARVVFWAWFLFGICFVLERHLGLYLTLGFLGWALSLPIWGDLWARMGPAEIYSALGLAFVLPLAQIILQKPEAGKIEECSRWLLLLLSALLLLGSKENWLLLPVPLLVFGICWWRFGGRSFWGLSFLTIIAAAWAFCTGAIVLGVRSAGHVYGADIVSQPLLNRGLDIVHGLLDALKLPLTFGFLSLVFVLWMTRHAFQAYRRRVITFSLVATLICFVCAVQILFYGSALQQAPRYLFPFLLCPLALWAAVFWFIINCLPKTKLGGAAKVVIKSVALVLCVTSWNMSSVHQLRAQAKGNSDMTVAFTGILTALSTKLKANGPSELVLESNGTLAEYELTISLARFFWYYGAHKVFLRIHASPRTPGADPFADKVFTELSQDSTSGLTNAFGVPILQPWSRLSIETQSKENCYSFGSSVKQDPTCLLIGALP